MLLPVEALSAFPASVVDPVEARATITAGWAARRSAARVAQRATSVGDEIGRTIGTYAPISGGDARPAPVPGA